MSQLEIVQPATTGFIPDLLASERLLPGARALLLLRLTQFARRLRPELAEGYWRQLRPIQGSLPAAHGQAFGELKALLEVAGEPKKSRFAFLSEIQQLAESAQSQAAGQPEAARAALEQAASRLQGLWWWPFGKARIWHTVVSVWTGLDRERALRLLSRASGHVRHEILLELNERQPLSESEWDLAFSTSRSAAVKAVTELLDRSAASLRLSDAAARAAAKDLLGQVHAARLSEEAERQREKERGAALERYQKLVTSTAGYLPETAESMLEDLFSATAATDIYTEKWLERFSALARMISLWARLPVSLERAEAFFKSKAPAHLRDLALSRWMAMFPQNQAEAEARWAAARAEFQDLAASESLYLVCLVWRGLKEPALAMAEASERSKDLVPLVRRAILCEYPEWAAANFTAADEGDVAGAFLLASTDQARVEFLRERTEKGQTSLPAEIWSKPDFGAVMGSKTSLHLRPSWYFKTDEPAKQFPTYVRINAFGQYSYDNVDPHLLRTLVAWDEQYPEETRGLVGKMWESIVPEDWELNLALHRTTVFDRCQAVLPACPRQFVEVFVQWLKKKLVDQPLRHQVGDTIYTLSLKDTTPFLYCLLAAQKLAPVSSARCLELIEIAMREYRASEEMAGWAAELYALGREPGEFDWNMDGVNSGVRAAWQCGLVDALKGRVVASLAEEAPGAAAT